MKVQLVTYDHPLKGHCDLEQWVKQILENFAPYTNKDGDLITRHPVFKNVEYIYPTSVLDARVQHLPIQDKDGIYLVIDNHVVKHWLDDKTFLMGDICREIVEILS